MGSGGIAPRNFIHDTRWVEVINLTPLPLYPQTISFLYSQQIRWTSELVWILWSRVKWLNPGMEPTYSGGIARSLVATLASLFSVSVRNLIQLILFSRTMNYTNRLPKLINKECVIFSHKIDPR
jgi:hypothetical protein